MGRGRQKAKHTKVARQLKYSAPETDLSQLERELAAKRSAEASDPWEEYAAKYDDSHQEEDSWLEAELPGYPAEDR